MCIGAYYKDKGKDNSLLLCDCEFIIFKTALTLVSTSQIILLIVKVEKKDGTIGTLMENMVHIVAFLVSVFFLANSIKQVCLFLSLS